ncbi:D-Ala-D-Ala carboxypeptidase family metallohydrolase [Oricola sp.]|uniref:YcbK family protein n=1 Tax=Oricola sp. TaxID=1979950 RepID=UPI0025DA427B|nr:D-Ala-D-Ala carboxypeptidase family metallohydrolase [Oricola sp.]MCI5075122.1 D-Ala-D-Ala carboxypeptidase family metallohydrolase [Oricola sp.]
MIFSTLARRVARALLAAALSATLLAFPASAQNPLNGDNPWRRIAVFDTDEAHAHLLLDPSPFDGMDALQLAAVPRGQRIHYNAPSKCVPGRLKSVLNRVAAKYGPITVNSTVRSATRNRKVGGKKSSWHLKCAAVDFRVHAGTKGLLTFLKKQKEVGGYKRYSSGFYHIDIGPRRTW